MNYDGTPVDDANKLVRISSSKSGTGTFTHTDRSPVRGIVEHEVFADKDVTSIKLLVSRRVVVVVFIFICLFFLTFFFGGGLCFSLVFCFFNL